MNTDFFIQSLISMLVITSVFDPVKILFFNQAIADPPRNRYAAAARVALYSVIVLGTTVLIGRQFLDIVGIRLDAFRVIGGLLIAIMGLEMLQGGGVSRSQGEGIRAKGPEEDDNLLIPLTLPLIAGPGAITTTITIAAHGDSFESVIAALLCVLIVGLVAFISYAWLGEIIGKAKPNTVSVLARIGGLLLATIGAQMLLGGLKDFFA